MRIELQDDEILVARGKRIDRTGRKRVLAADHEGKAALIQHLLDNG